VNHDGDGRDKRGEGRSLGQARQTHGFTRARDGKQLLMWRERAETGYRV